MSMGSKPTNETKIAVDKLRYAITAIKGLQRCASSASNEAKTYSPRPKF